MQEEINEVLDLEVDYLSAIADMLNEFGFSCYHCIGNGILHLLCLEICDR